MSAVEFNIHPGKGTWLKCYLWDTLEEMRTDTATKNLKKADTAFACYLGNDWLFNNGDLKTRKLGELHFVNGDFGVGTFAHEIQHFISHFSVVMEWNVIDEHWEKVSELAQKLAAEFWNNFWKNYEE